LLDNAAGQNGDVVALKEILKNFPAFGANSGDEQGVETQILEVKGVVKQSAAGADKTGFGVNI
jgi:hypothetical protein